MGNDRNEESVGSFRRPAAGDKRSGKADWSSVDANKVLRAIAAAAGKSGALRFGYTRDGGAYSVGVYAGSNYFTDYIRPNESVEAYLDELVESFSEYIPESSAPPQKRQARKV